MIESKPPFKQAAFTLLELIIVIAVLAIISSYILTRPDTSSDYQQDAIVEQLISSGQLAQQLSMNDSARAFSLVISANQIDLLADGVSFTTGNIGYPINVPAAITLNPAIVINFDNLGSTAGTIINVQGTTTDQVCFDAGGAIRQC